MVGALFSMMRPGQWIKNVVVFLPVFFAGEAFHSWCWREGLLTFAAFSLMASSVYCFNDLIDLESDRLHPEKKKRPLPSGKLKPTQVAILMTMLILMSTGLSMFLPPDSAYKISLILFLYLFLNICYSIKLKDIIIIDVLCIAVGFVLRLAAGGISCDIPVSPWIIVLTALLSLFLALSKRHNEIILCEKQNIILKGISKKYNLPYLNLSLISIGTVMIVCYFIFIYCLSSDVILRFNTKYLYITSVFVAAAILRYLQLTIIKKSTHTPGYVLFHDIFIQIYLVLWFITFSILTYPSSA